MYSHTSCKNDLKDQGPYDLNRGRSVTYLKAILVINVHIRGEGLSGVGVFFFASMLLHWFWSTKQE